MGYGGGFTVGRGAGWGWGSSNMGHFAPTWEKNNTCLALPSSWRQLGEIPSVEIALYSAAKNKSKTFDIR